MTREPNTLFQNAYDMTDVALSMHGYIPGEIPSTDYARIILSEIHRTLVGIEKERQTPILHKKDLVRSVGKPIRERYIDRTSILSVTLDEVGQRLIGSRVISPQSFEEIKRKKIGVQRKIDLLLAMERIELDADSLAPGISHT